MRRRFTVPLAAVALSLPLTLGSAVSASAAPADKPQVLSSWTQTSASSYNAWTDYCSSSPDNPFGFPFQNSCARHDFGYRNHKAAGTFSANKARIDSAFYEDLKRVCAGYSGATKTSCNSTAWTYYQAVKVFGVSPADAGARNLPQTA
ncbi:phospholipase [Streptomyces sp. MBT98]|uniref:phospholipase n=1 Tax=Streptomyces sp. MBT98 TaxID=2800412 RepID=UPI001909DAA3|nr:phospholipase [Streptomyces sp. MBT98]MBK3615733.1 phospholipase [Streptomyces sp. MBT98]